jgi:hypothetical protein
MALFTNYQYPVIGTTPPTVAQMGTGGIATMIVAQISMLDADTSGVLVTNYNHSPTAVQRLFPVVSYYFDVVETAYPGLTFGQLLPNSLLVGKNAGSGTGFTATVFILRPHSLIA